jgi:DNA-binding MarR family transcriptional regulator
MPGDARGTSVAELRPTPRGGLSDARMAAWRAFLEAHARATAQLSRELLEEESLPLAWYDVLVQLSEAPDQRLRMQELADRVLLSQSGLTRLVDRMQKDGLVERLRCASDGRGTYATLTPAGLAQLRRAYPTHLRGVRAWFADLLDEDEARVLARALTRIADTAHPPAPSGGPDRTGGC